MGYRWLSGGNTGLGARFTIIPTLLRCTAQEGLNWNCHGIKQATNAHLMQWPWLCVESRSSLNPWHMESFLVYSHGCCMSSPSTGHTRHERDGLWARQGKLKLSTLTSSVWWRLFVIVRLTTHFMTYLMISIWCHGFILLCNVFCCLTYNTEAFKIKIVYSMLSYLTPSIIWIWTMFPRCIDIRVHRWCICIYIFSLSPLSRLTN